VIFAIQVLSNKNKEDAIKKKLVEENKVIFF
jgi:hypothetical protein